MRGGHECVQRRRDNESVQKTRGVRFYASCVTIFECDMSAVVGGGLYLHFLSLSTRSLK